MKKNLRELLNIVLMYRVRRAIALTLAVIVTFTATYALVLPAITLEKDAAETMSGIDLGGNSQTQDTSDSSGKDDSDEGASDDSHTDTVTFDAEAKNENGETEALVHVEADADTFPEGTTMEASVVTDQSVIDSIAESAEGEVVAVHAVDLTFTDENGVTVQPAEGSQVSVTLSAGEDKTSGTQNAENESEPADQADEHEAEESSAAQATETTVVQYTEEDGAEPVETSEDVSFQIEPETDLDQDNAVSFDLGEQTVDQDTQTYAIVETIPENDGMEEDETEEADMSGSGDLHADETAAEQTEDVQEEGSGIVSDEEELVTEVPVSAQEELPAEPEETVLTAQGASYLITVTYGPEAQIPHDAYLDVEEILTEDTAYENHLEETQKTLNEAAQADAAEDGVYAGPAAEEPQFFGARSLMSDSIAFDMQKAEAAAEAEPEIVYARFFDITIMSTAGEEITPAAPVRVSIELLDAEQDEETIQSADTARVIHFGEEETEMVEAEVIEDTVAGVTFDAAGFSVYGVVYTVDFHAGDYTYSIQGGSGITLRELFPILGIEADADDVENAAFSDPSLVWVGKADSDSTVGGLKEANGLEVRYSEELTEEQIAELNARTVEAGSWVLISLKPFSTEETLTVTMKDGTQFVVKVTDAQQIPDAEAGTIDVNKSYVICYQAGRDYYLLKNDGSVEKITTNDPEQAFEGLNSTYCWSFNRIFKEKDVQTNLDKNYYLIRPIDDRSKTIALNYAGQALVQQSNNNVAVIQTEGGFLLEGYHNVGTEEAPRYIQLGFSGGSFSGVDGQGVTVLIYEMDELPTYDYTVRSADEERGSVRVRGGTQQTETHDAVTTHYYDATSNSDKMNGGTITAAPATHKDENGVNKWLFDHWEQDGTPLDRDQYPAVIDADTLPIPFNGSSLVAYFSQNPAYDVPPEEKLPSSIEDMTQWFNDLTTRSVPLDDEATEKTAEVYDYENRIYRVDITSQANFDTFAGNIDMAFCLDVSNSMKFPSKLVEASTNYYNNTNPIPVYRINSSGSSKNWLDTRRGYSDPYYLIADASGTATVFRVYYQGGYWKAQDASRESESDKSFRIGVDDFSTSYGQDARHPFTVGDNDYTTYTIYNAGDNGHDRFYYLNQTLSDTSTDLQTIMNLLKVAGDESPDVKIAYNTFNKNLGSQRRDFRLAEPLQIDFAYSAGGGTRPDQAFYDAQSFNWTAGYNAATGETDRYVILITDGAPQGIRDGESKNIDFVETAKAAARNLKSNSHVKLITIGLSMENVTEGRKLLYDIADADKNGNPMFYLAESASDLPNIMRQIIKTIMEDAVVYANVTDTVNDAFYPVDKTTGLPLQYGDMIDIEGRKTTDKNQAAGIVQSDGKTILWTHQAIDQVNGWHGTLYVKAREDLIGGNAVKTNGEASVTATGYTVSGDERFFDDSLVYDKLKSLNIDLDSPRVNVNELTFSNTDTEWTVYLGTEVDPKEQLEKLYEAIQVEEVVNEDGTLHFDISPNSISDDRDDTEEEHGTAAAFSLAEAILERIKNEGVIENNTIVSGSKYLDGDTLNWNAFLTDLLKDGGVMVPYHPYGIEGAESNLVLTLTKTIADNEEADLENNSPHTVSVTGDEVEKYVLSVKYNPDYTNVLPIGQGGGGSLEYHTGTYGTMYQGHAAGRETSESTHVIHVFAKKLKIEKADEWHQTITGSEAVFGLYRKATDEELQDEQVEKTTLSGVNGQVVLVQRLTTENGVITTEPLKLLKGTESYDEPYYLAEERAPAGYSLLAEPLMVTISLSETAPLDHNVWTSVPDGAESNQKPDPYALSNWLQEATITVTDMEGLDSVSAVRVIPEGEHGITYDHTNDTTDASVTYKIINNAGYELPSTGGMGTELFTGLGAILFAGAGMMLWRRWGVEYSKCK